MISSFAVAPPSPHSRRPVRRSTVSPASHSRTTSATTPTSATPQRRHSHTSNNNALNASDVVAPPSPSPSSAGSSSSSSSFNAQTISPLHFADDQAADDSAFNESASSSQSLPLPQTASPIAVAASELSAVESSNRVELEHIATKREAAIAAAIQMRRDLRATYDRARRELLECERAVNQSASISRSAASRQAQLETVIRVREETFLYEARKMRDSPNGAQWETPHHFHLAALDHYMHRTPQPALPPPQPRPSHSRYDNEQVVNHEEGNGTGVPVVDIALLMRGHLRLLAISNCQNAGNHAILNTHVVTRQQNESQTQRLAALNAAVRHARAEMNDTECMSSLLKAKCGAEMQRFKERRRRARDSQRAALAYMQSVSERKKEATVDAYNDTSSSSMTALSDNATEDGRNIALITPSLPSHTTDTTAEAAMSISELVDEEKIAPRLALPKIPSFTQTLMPAAHAETTIPKSPSTLSSSSPLVSSPSTSNTANTSDVDVFPSSESVSSKYSSSLNLRRPSIFRSPSQISSDDDGSDLDNDIDGDADSLYTSLPRSGSSHRLSMSSSDLQSSDSADGDALPRSNSRITVSEQQPAIAAVTAAVNNPSPERKRWWHRFFKTTETQSQNDNAITSQPPSPLAPEMRSAFMLPSTLTSSHSLSSMQLTSPTSSTSSSSSSAVTSPIHAHSTPASPANNNSNNNNRRQTLLLDRRASSDKVCLALWNRFETIIAEMDEIHSAHQSAWERLDQVLLAKHELMNNTHYNMQTNSARINPS